MSGCAVISMLMVLLLAPGVLSSLSSSSLSTSGSVSTRGLRDNSQKECYTRTYDIFEAQLIEREKYNFVICPGTTIDIGFPVRDNASPTFVNLNFPSLEYLTTYRNGDFPLIVFRPNVTITCGNDDNNNHDDENSACLLRGGQMQFLAPGVLPPGLFLGENNRALALDDSETGGRFGVSHNRPPSTIARVDNLYVSGLTFSSRSANVNEDGNDNEDTQLAWVAASTIVAAAGKNIVFNKCLWKKLAATDIVLVGVGVDVPTSDIPLVADLHSMNVTIRNSRFQDIYYGSSVVSNYWNGQNITLDTTVFDNVLVSQRFNTQRAAVVSCSSGSHCELRRVCFEQVQFQDSLIKVKQFNAANQYMATLIGVDQVWGNDLSLAQLQDQENPVQNAVQNACSEGFALSVSPDRPNEHCRNPFETTTTSTTTTCPEEILSMARGRKTPAPTPAPAPSGGFGFCFSSETTVMVQNKGLVRMQDLKIGDLIQVESSKQDGSTAFSRVYSFGHRHEHVETTYLQLHSTSLERPLEITSNHMLMARKQTKTDGKSEFIAAAQVVVGDHLVVVRQQQHQEERLLARVDKITQIKRPGAYAPFTESGTLLVNGVIASSYISIPQELSSISSSSTATTTTATILEKINHWVSLQWLSHGMVAPLRIQCRLFLDSCNNETYGPSGLSMRVGALWQWLLPLFQEQTNSDDDCFALVFAVFSAIMIGFMASLFLIVEQIMNNWFIIFSIATATIVGTRIMFSSKMGSKRQF